MGRVGREFGHWNASGGVDHFYVSCHSVGREAAGRHRGLRDNAVGAGRVLGQLFPEDVCGS